MSTAKSIIIAEILKQKKPFRPRDIWDATGVSRQLLNNHLQKLVVTGLLTKRGVYYEILNEEALIESLLEGSSANGVRAPEKTMLFNPKGSLVELLQWVAALRVLEDPRYERMSIIVNQQLTAAEKELKAAKNYVNKKQFSDNRAAKVKKDPGFELETLWANYQRYLEEYFTYQEFVKEQYK